MSYTTLLTIIIVLLVMLLVTYIIAVTIHNKQVERKHNEAISYLKQRQMEVNQSFDDKEKWIVELQTLRDNYNRSDKKLTYKQLTFQQREQLTKKFFYDYLKLEDFDHFTSMVDNKLNGFMTNMLNDFPSLTEKETILLVLYLLRTSDTDICTILEYSPNSLPVIKNRLIKKLNVESSTQLVDFLNSRLK